MLELMTTTNYAVHVYGTPLYVFSSADMEETQNVTEQF
jgi:hypothetical protein